MATNNFTHGPSLRFEADGKAAMFDRPGLMWVKWRLIDGRWVHAGRMWAPARATRQKIISLFTA